VTAKRSIRQQVAFLPPPVPPAPRRFEHYPRVSSAWIGAPRNRPMKQTRAITGQIPAAKRASSDIVKDHWLLIDDAGRVSEVCKRCVVATASGLAPNAGQPIVRKCPTVNAQSDPRAASDIPASRSHPQQSRSVRADVVEYPRRPRRRHPAGEHKSTLGHERAKTPQPNRAALRPAVAERGYKT